MKSYKYNVISWVTVIGFVSAVWLCGYSAHVLQDDAPLWLTLVIGAWLFILPPVFVVFALNRILNIMVATVIKVEKEAEK